MTAKRTEVWLDEKGIAKYNKVGASYENQSRGKDGLLTAYNCPKAVEGFTKKY